MKIIDIVFVDFEYVPFEKNHAINVYTRYIDNYLYTIVYLYSIEHMYILF